ncbi:MAG: hypothetical protein ACRCV3_02260 [Desulfovibrionaceae bacterium]
MRYHRDVSIGKWDPTYEMSLFSLLRRIDCIDLQMIAKQENISSQKVFSNTISQSTQIYSVLINSICHGAFGVRTYPLYPHSAFIWFLCSDALFLRKRSILSLVPKQIEYFHKEYPLLLNYISAENLPSTAPFLRYCGFTIGESYQYKGTTICTFYKFSKKLLR